MTPRRTARDYWILDPEQIRCLASVPRHDMVDRLAAEGPMSVRDLAAAIGMKPSALYHHLQRLLDVGLVEEAGTRVVHRKTERLYGTPSPRMRLRRALDRPEFRDLMIETVGALCRQMDRDFAEGIGSSVAKTDGPGRNLGFFRLLGAPSPRTLREINRRLEEIAELLWHDRSPDAPLIALGWTLAPVRQSTGSPRSEPEG